VQQATDHLSAKVDAHKLFERLKKRFEARIVCRSTGQ
jgi:hypothetical protein